MTHDEAQLELSRWFRDPTVRADLLAALSEGSPEGRILHALRQMAHEWRDGCLFEALDLAADRAGVTVVLHFKRV